MPEPHCPEPLVPRRYDGGLGDHLGYVTEAEAVFQGEDFLGRQDRSLAKYSGAYTEGAHHLGPHLSIRRLADRARAGGHLASVARKGGSTEQSAEASGQ